MEIINDSKNYIGIGLQTQGDAVRSVVRSTDIAGGIFRSQGVMYIGNKQVRIDNKEPKLVINNGVQDNILIGKRTDGTYGFDIAKSGSDVNGASNSDLFYSDRFIKVSYKFTDPAEIPSIGSDGINADGLILYYRDTGNDIYNTVQFINFYKESNLTIESCIVQTKWHDGYALDQTTRVRPGACSLFLNASPTKTTEGASMAQVYSGGTTLATITPNANGYTNTETLSTAEIASISDGWNTILIQSNSSTTDYLGSWGTVALDVSIKGYLT
jgi:hypothetical protein